MNEPVGQPRRYTEEEVGRILKRATEIQIADPSSPGAAGMTLDELEEIALEAGIDPRHLRRAALEVQSGAGDDSLASRLAGRPFDLSVEATVAGELSEAGFERVASEIHQAVRDHGRSSQIGRTLTWQGESAQKTRSMQVIVTSRDGETRIRVEERMHELAKQLFAGLVWGGGVGAGTGIGVGIGLGALNSALFAAVFPLGAVGLAYIGAREVYRRQVEGRQRAMTGLLERVRAEVERSVGATTIAASEGRRALPEG